MGRGQGERQEKGEERGRERGREKETEGGDKSCMAIVEHFKAGNLLWHSEHLVLPTGFVVSGVMHTFWAYHYSYLTSQ